MTQHPSGEQWTLRHGPHEATVVEVGGGLRTWTRGGADVLAGYGLDEVASSGRGQLLMPWPNRIRDGRYSFEGVEHQLPLTEPARQNASHGLVRWATWHPLDLAPDRVVVGTRLHPQPGWDGTLDLTTSYTLDEQGLTVTSTATNVGAGAVPFGYGAHPYVAIGDTPLAEVVLHLPASEEVLVDDRLLPTGTAAARPDLDFRQPRPLGATSLDTAYTGLERDAGTGRWAVTVGGLRDRGDVTLWADEAFGWTQVFTEKGADGLPVRTRGVAVEPMTCPADAFNSGQGLVVLAAGESWSGTWGMTVSAG